MTTVTGTGTALTDRAAGCLAGAAVGDALGGATEGFSPEQIRERHGGPVDGIVGPWFADWRTARPNSPYHKGDGHVTDDTLMTRVLARAYLDKRDRLDAYDVERLVVPMMVDETTWIPELEEDAPLLRRVFLAEKWLVLRLRYAHADPREAGVGNVVNCGAAMYMAPVGVVNAAAPDTAYREAIELAGAHQSSYGREAAGVFAAAVAAAMAPDATADTVADAALTCAQDGTRAAVEAVVAAARGGGDTAALRDAVRPYDTVGETYREPAPDARRPSRVRAIEELPVALGCVVLAGGDYRRAVLTGVNYGRDADSIASMAGAIAGALGGLTAVPEEWRTAVATASRLDLTSHAAGLADLAVELADRDRRSLERRLADLERLTRIP